MNEELIRKVIAEVMAEVMAGEKQAAPGTELSAPAAAVKITELEKATKGVNPKEVVLAITPGFGVHFQGTIIDVPHGEVIRQIMAGVEEEGLTCRVIRVYHTADVAFMSHYAARLSGSGIGIGVLAGERPSSTRGTWLPSTIWSSFPSRPCSMPRSSAPSGATPPSTPRASSPFPWRRGTTPWPGPASRGWRLSSTTRRCATSIASGLPWRSKSSSPAREEVSPWQWN